MIIISTGEAVRWVRHRRMKEINVGFSIIDFSGVGNSLLNKETFQLGGEIETLNL
ncbi:MAG: hypothetical protein KDJ52_21910 [Anaerolineae bacterium]|nr:hypothetical protein [Anaerolineae bacterium]